MHTTTIRGLSAALIHEAGRKQEPLAITNDGALCGVLVPVDEQWIHRAVEQNVSRIWHNVERGEREIASGLPATSLDDLEPSADRGGDPPPARQGAFSAERTTLKSADWPTISVRDLSGAVIKEAAQNRTGLFVTTAGKLSGLLMPVTPAWVKQVVERNISRVMYNIERGEKEIAAEDSVVPVNDWQFTEA